MGSRLTSEEPDIPKYRCSAARSPPGGPGDLREVPEAAHASWCEGLGFPRSLGRRLCYTGDPFSVFSLQFCGPALSVVARLRCQSCHVLDVAVPGLGTAKALTALRCALCRSGWLSSALHSIFLPFCCSLPAAKPSSFACAHGRPCRARRRRTDEHLKTSLGETACGGAAARSLGSARPAPCHSPA